MKAIDQTALERALLARFHQLYQEEGFPRADLVNVVWRANTGGGRYANLECDAPVQVADGYLDLAGGFVEMEGLPNGLMAVVLVNKGRLRILELTVYGGDFWDGEERTWRIV